MKASEGKLFLGLIAIIVIAGSLVYFLIKTELPQEGPNTTQATVENLPQLEDRAQRVVTRVIDEDTFVLEGGYPVRLLGLTPNKKPALVISQQKNF